MMLDLDFEADRLAEIAPEPKGKTLNVFDHGYIIIIASHETDLDSILPKLSRRIASKTQAPVSAPSITSPSLENRQQKTQDPKPKSATSNPHK
jgi:hypothetical protein